MVLGTIKRALGGDYNENQLRKLYPLVKRVNEHTEAAAAQTTAQAFATPFLVSGMIATCAIVVTSRRISSGNP